MSAPTYARAIEVLEREAESALCVASTATAVVLGEVDDLIALAAELTEAADVLRRVAAITAAIEIVPAPEPAGEESVH